MPHSYRIPSSLRHLFKQSGYCYLKLFLTYSHVRAFYVLGSFPSPDIIHEYGRIHNVWSQRLVHLVIESGTFECHVSVRSSRKDFRYAKMAVSLPSGCFFFWIQSRMNNAQNLIPHVRVGSTLSPLYTPYKAQPIFSYSHRKNRRQNTNATRNTSEPTLSSSAYVDTRLCSSSPFAIYQKNNSSHTSNTPRNCKSLDRIGKSQSHRLLVIVFL